MNWKAIEGFDGNYLVSDTGLVKSVSRQQDTPNGGSMVLPDKFLTVHVVCGYSQVTLHKGGIPFMKKVHRLVAEAFILNPANKKEVNHKDGNKQNNTVENLEWATSSENHLHAFATGLRLPQTGKDHHGAKIVLNLHVGIYYDSATEAAKFSTYKLSTLQAMLSGRHPNRSPFIYV